ncbi:MAG TPA: zinc-binding dehydrogenase [Polyangiaceae bacterium]
MKALVFSQIGEATEVLTYLDAPKPTPAPGEVLVAVEASPVHPADFSFVRGAYRVKPKCPQVAGLSGAGRVVALGEGAKFSLGTRVAFRWPGAWAEFVALPAERAFAVPAEIEVDAAAQFVINPITAFGLLDVARAEPGEWIALSAASSSVAALVSALATERGLRVIGIAREASLPGLASYVAGVAEQAPDLAERVRAITGGAGVAALIDCVGGPLVSSLFPALRQGATIVAYGTISPEPIVVKNATLVYSNLTWQGFGIDRWSQSLGPEQHTKMTETLWAEIRAGRLPLPVQAHHDLPDFLAALRRAAGGGLGKVMFAPRAPQ